MTREANSVGNTVQYGRDGAQNVAHIGFDVGTASSKHRAILAIDDLNT